MKLRWALAPYWRESISARVRSIKVKTIGIWIAIVIVHIVGTAHAQELVPRLWIADDASTVRKVFEVPVDGGLPFSFFPDTQASADCTDQPEICLKKTNSGIALDPSDDTLWGATEITFSGLPLLPRGGVFNFGKDGVALRLIRAEDFGAFSVEGVDVDHFDDSLWVVDDPIGVFSGEVPTVYHISKDGTLIDSFPTSTFAASSETEPPLDPPFNAARSPQAIATDPCDGTLWVTDNSNSDRVYNIDRDGTPIDSFRVKGYDLSAGNPQGISVDDSDGTLWVTDRTSQRIYNITRTGDFITSFDSTEYGGVNPTAIAFDWRAATTRLRAVIHDLQTVVDDLGPGVSGDDMIDRDIIIEAIEQIEKSLKPKQWLDRATPLPKTKVGGKVFNGIKRGVVGRKDSGGLIRVSNTNGNTDVSGDIDALVDISLGLAIAAYNWATDERDMACLDDPSSVACTDANKKIADYAKKLAEAQKELDKGDFKRAIGKIKDMWKKAREAIQKANPNNHKPVANPDTQTTAIGQPLWLQLTGSDPDGDDLWFVLDKQPRDGTLVLNSICGVALYTPPPGFIGEAGFAFWANDGIQNSDKREVKIKVE